MKLETFSLLFLVDNFFLYFLLIVNKKNSKFANFKNAPFSVFFYLFLKMIQFFSKTTY